MVGKRYRILEQLGKGAFGTVYRAEVLAAGDFRKQVALKVLDYKGDAPEEITLRFRDEARILGLIRHRAIVGVDSLAELETGWAVVMEYVDGVNISAVVRYGLPPARVILGILEEVASALHAAYSAKSDVTGEPLKLVHRDIKPANVRLTAQGEVKVLDFGVAQAEFDSREARTQAMRFGSLRYMAPESFDGIEGHPTDVFALGIVLGELLSGQRFDEPPKNPDRYPAFLAQVSSQVDQRLGVALSAEHLAQVMDLQRRMIAFEPEHRPTARDVEMAARELASRLPGQTLRDWAEVNVPILVEQQARKKSRSQPDTITTSILAEKSSPQAFDLPTGTAPVRPVAHRTPSARLEDTGTRPTGSHTAAAAGAGAAIGAGVTVLVLLGVIVIAGWFALESLTPRGTPERGPAQVAAPPVSPEPPPVPVPTPVPVVVPAPAMPVAPSPRAGVAPAPIPPPVTRPQPSPEPSGALVQVEGDAVAVQLVSSSGSFRAGPVPAGTYRIMADFGDGNQVQAGTLTARDGETVSVRCYGVMLKCSKAK